MAREAASPRATRALLEQRRRAAARESCRATSRRRCSRPRATAPVLLIRPVARLSDSALLQVKERRARGVRGARRDAGSREVGIDCGSVVLGAAAPRRARSRSRLVVPSRSTAPSPAWSSSRARAPDAFGEGDARVLDVLVNEVRRRAARASRAKRAGERQRLERVVECMADGLVFAATGRRRGRWRTRPRAACSARRSRGRSPAEWLEGRARLLPVRSRPRHRAGSVGPRVRPGGGAPPRPDALSSIVSPVAEPDGRLAGVAIVLRDITEQKGLEERKEEFVQVVSHELRTPLTVDHRRARPRRSAGSPASSSEKQARYLKMARESTEKLNAHRRRPPRRGAAREGQAADATERASLDELVRARWSATSAARRSAATSSAGRDAAGAGADRRRRRARRPGAREPAHQRDEVHARGRRRPRAGCSAPPALPGSLGLSVWNNGEAICRARPRADLREVRAGAERPRRGASAAPASASPSAAASSRRTAAHLGGEPAGDGVRFVVVLPEEPPAEPAERAALGRTRRVVARRRRAGRGDARSAGVLAGARHALPRARAAARGARRWRADDRPRLVVCDPRLAALAGVPLSPRSCGTTRRRGRPRSSRSPIRASVRRRPRGRRRLPAEARRAGGARRPRPSALLRDGRPARRQDARRRRRPGHPRDLRATCSRATATRSRGGGAAREARAAIVERRPQLVLSTWSCPDGTASRCWRSSPRSARPSRSPVIFLSARGETADKVRAFKLGAEDYMVKPFDAPSWSRASTRRCGAATASSAPRRRRSSRAAARSSARSSAGSQRGGAVRASATSTSTT